MAGGGAEASNGGFASKHPGGVNFLFGDGHISFLTDGVDHVTYQQLASRDRAEVLTESIN
nr:DUF1559 domain-containing protein [Pirellulimonas nuda]